MNKKKYPTGWRPAFPWELCLIIGLTLYLGYTFIPSRNDPDAIAVRQWTHDKLGFPEHVYTKPAPASVPDECTSRLDKKSPTYLDDLQACLGEIQ